MPELSGVELWVGLAVAALGVLTAILKLITVLQERLDHQASKDPPPLVVPSPAVVQRHSLLPDRPAFVNRTREMKDLVARAQAGRSNVLTIEGDRLVGKSAAAKELVHCLISESAEGPFDPTDRTFVWINARGGCPSLSYICRSLSLLTEDQSLSAAADKTERLRIHLASHKTVLVLDNLILSDNQESKALIDFLREVPDGSMIIATVNRPSDLVSSRVELRDFDVSCVDDLITDCVERLNLDGANQFDGDFAKRLYRLIGGNPGVIEWFLRGYHDSSESLEDRVAAIEKGEDLSELFEPTWEALGERERAALAACAYLRGEATARQLAVTCDRPEAEMRDVADQLRREGILTPVRASNQPTVFTCAQAFRLFVIAKGDWSTRLTFTQRLADYYIKYFTTNPEDAEFAVSEVGAIRVVREELFEITDDVRMQALFVVVLDVLLTLGQFDEVIDAADLAYKSAAAIDNFAGASLAAGIEACTHAMRGEAGAALAAYTNGSVAAESSRLPAPVARLQRCRGFLHYRSREPRHALRAIAETEQIARNAKDGINIVDTLDLRTAASWYLGAFEDCEVAARASLEQSEAMEWGRARAYPLRFLAEVAIHRRCSDEARALLDEASDVASRFGDQRQVARVDLTRARLLFFEGNLEAAESAALRAVSEASRLGLPPEEEESLALANAIRRSRRSRLWRRYYAWRHSPRLTDAPVGGD